MPLPNDGTRLASVRDFPTWRRTVEALLTRIDHRLAGITQAGIVVNYTGLILPANLLLANGQVVNADDYPRLFAQIGVYYNTGGEAAGTFRVPDYTTPPEHGVWAITT